MFWVCSWRLKYWVSRRWLRLASCSKGMAQSWRSFVVQASDIYPMFIEPTITWVPSGFSGYIWLDTKIVLKKKKKKKKKRLQPRTRNDEFSRSTIRCVSQSMECRIVRPVLQHLGQIRRRLSMQTFVNQKTKFEVNPLFDGKPMKAISNVVWNRIKLSFSHDKAISNSDDRLKLAHQADRNSSQQTITIVKPAGDECMHKWCACSEGKWSTNGTKLAQLVVTRPACSLNMGFHGQMTI